jgi:hypothetical protein
MDRLSIWWVEGSALSEQWVSSANASLCLQAFDGYMHMHGLPIMYIIFSQTVFFARFFESRIVGWSFCFRLQMMQDLDCFPSSVFGIPCGFLVSTSKFEQTIA